MSIVKNKKISIVDLHIGDLVLGQHVDLARQQYSIVAGQITKITKIDDAKVRYHVKGITLSRPPYGEPPNFSGIINSDEIEITDPDTYQTIMDLYDLANKQIIAGVSYQETVDKIREIRHKSRQELEETYGV